MIAIRFFDRFGFEAIWVLYVPATLAFLLRLDAIAFILLFVIFVKIGASTIWALMIGSLKDTPNPIETNLLRWRSPSTFGDAFENVTMVSLSCALILRDQYDLAAAVFVSSIFYCSMVRYLEHEFA